MQVTLSIRSLIIFILISSTAYAGVSRIQEADQFKSSDHTKTWSLPAAADTLVGRASTDTLTNKTLTSPVLTTPSMSSIVNTGTLTLPTSTDTLVGRATTDTLTNKTISGASNTLSQLPVGTQMTQYTVTPSPNGTATTFTLSPTPPANGSVQLHLDGIFLRQGSGLDYTISGATVTMTSAPAAGQILYVIYSQF